jgi:hypothetical protein
VGNDLLSVMEAMNDEPVRPGEELGGFRAEIELKFHDFPLPNLKAGRQILFHDTGMPDELPGSLRALALSNNHCPIGTFRS